ARAGAGATNLFTTAFGTPAALQMPDSKSEVIVNPVVGSVTVLATERQHELVQQYLDGVMQAAQRQVLIEATIVEVALSDKYKAGVDWSRLASGAGFTINQQLLAGNLGTPPNITIGYANATSAVGNVSATLSLLESFGNIRVLSSPKLMALNNQTALLKVVNNVVYFSIEAQTSTTQGVATTTFNTTPHTIPVGVVMAVTPQINDNSMVTLTVRPTISRVVGFKNDPNPNLGTGATRINNPVPEVQVREMESVLQVSSGQTVILGGLMQDDVTRNRDAVPGLGGLPAVGDAFSYRDESATKTELVIFLRPTSIANPSLDSDELKFFRRYLPSSSAATTP
ncbi:MAG: pilus (MSHA type) biogenesis protein MshL, partial [Pseudomonadota bacterium]